MTERSNESGISAEQVQTVPKLYPWQRYDHNCNSPACEKCAKFSAEIARARQEGKA